MWRLFFKFELGGEEVRIDCQTRETAVRMWQLLIDAGMIPQCPEP